ncbi:MAG TPA: phosphatase PAP2 family protein [Rhodopila sp.]|nr:phosphatase PAP2 family protein [Rhodopila sp.]
MAASSIGIVVASVLAGSLLYGRYTLLRPDPYLSAIIGGLTILIWAGFVAGTTALAALRTGAPLIDADLARVDALLGVHTPSLIAWLTAHHMMTILAPAYRSTVPLLFVAVILLGVMRREAAIWELCLSFTASAAICTLVSSIIPAAGTFVHYTIPSDVIAALPQKAGSYYLQVFNSYRSGAADTIDIRHFEGVVQFPSFHTCMALMLAYSVRSIRWLFVPVCVWSGLTILATMPMGGHYFADVLAGACVWALCTLPYPRLLTRSRNGAIARAQNA